jgi:riboflavin kinase/FMN adenylyltransferase
MTMALYQTLEAIPDLPTPLALTLGFFDGVHLGHRTLLQHLREQGFPVVLTFENHPAEIVRPEAIPPRLCSIPHKLKLLHEAGVETVILLPFTTALSQLSAEEFLQKVRRHIPFDSLLLGPDATLGKDKQGDQKRLQNLSKELHFHLEYLPGVTRDGKKVSSSSIRERIQAGDFATAELLLGRKFSIYAPIHSGIGLGKKIGFPTLNMPITGLCHPPFGVYAVTLNSWQGVANLGVAPTVRTAPEPILEVHLFEYPPSIQDQSQVEVTFHKFLRPEKKFENIEQLKEQIGLDVQTAKNQFLVGHR